MPERRIIRRRDVYFQPRRGCGDESLDAIRRRRLQLAMDPFGNQNAVEHLQDVLQLDQDQIVQRRSCWKRRSSRTEAIEIEAVLLQILFVVGEVRLTPLQAGRLPSPRTRTPERIRPARG
jgi:hypothetical protein